MLAASFSEFDPKRKSRLLTKGSVRQRPLEVRFAALPLDCVFVGGLGLVVLEIDRHLLDLAVEPEGIHVVRGDRRAGIQSDICALSRRESAALGHLDSTLLDLRAVHEQSAGARFPAPPPS